MRLKIILPALLVPLFAVGALVSGILPVAGNALLEDAQSAVSGAIDQVGGIVDQAQGNTSDAAPVDQVQPDESTGEHPSSDEEVTPPIELTPLDLPGYLPGTANGIALIQTTRVDSPTHQGWVDITLDLMLTGRAAEDSLAPSITLNEDATLACFGESLGFQDCLGVDWGSKEQFRAILEPHPVATETWPKGKAFPWTTSFEIPANAQIATLVFGNSRVGLNLGGDQPMDNSAHALAESYRPTGNPDAPTGTDGYFIGQNHGIAVTSVVTRPHNSEPTWSIVDIGLNVMAFRPGNAIDLPIQVQEEDGLVCYASGGESDCVQILWGGINQFDAILTSSRESGTVPWPRSKGWPTTVSFIVPSNTFSATLLYGADAAHLDLLGEVGEPPAWDYQTHFNQLTGLTLHDQDGHSIDLIAVDRNAVTADVELVFEAVNRSENLDFYPRIIFNGSRVSAAGQVFDGLHPKAGWAPVVQILTSDSLAPGQSSEIVMVLPRVEGIDFPEIPHSDDPPTAMLLRLFGDNNANAADPSEAMAFEPFYVTFDQREGDNDAVFFFPDLVAGPITLSPALPTVGDAVVVSIDISNDGPRNARAATAALLVNGVVYSTVDVPAIAAHGTATIRLPWVATQLGAQLAVVVDPADVVAESVYTNNTGTFAYSGGALPDLVVTGVEMTAPSTANGNVPQFAVTVKNQGDGNAKPYKVIASIDGGGGFFMQYSSLKAGASETSVYPWTEAIGSANLTLRVDSSNSIQETDDGNNIHVVSLPDLATTQSISVDINESGEVRLNFEIINQGLMDTPSALVKVIVDGQTNRAQPMSTGPLAAGESVLLTSAALPDDGRHTIQIQLDPLGVLPEADNDNNAIDFTYTIGELAELNVTTPSLTPNPFEFGALLTLEFVVKNTGGRKSEATIAQIYDDETAALLGTAEVRAIEPGEEAPVTFEWTVETALTKLRIELDPTFLVDEEMEDNNTTVLSLGTP